MMKKIKKYKLPIGILCVVLVIFILLQIFSSEHWWFGYTYETDGYTNKSATIVKINYPSEKVVIPDNIADRGIAYGAFSGCTSLKSINIPDNITAIQRYTFSNCISLKQLVLSKNIKSIEWGAFENCTLLEKIIIYDKVEYIADNAFEGCDKLTIYGIKGSYAEQYATEHNIPFTEIKE